MVEMYWYLCYGGQYFSIPFSPTCLHGLLVWYAAFDILCNNNILYIGTYIMCMHLTCWYLLPYL